MLIRHAKRSVFRSRHDTGGWECWPQYYSMKSLPLATAVIVEIQSIKDFCLKTTYVMTQQAMENEASFQPLIKVVGREKNN
ncbi:CLUMA_CG003345, isoform A [Clunio marinus]|uniref:CLUMA_CG003345, isoform A n=1 Tax=Clunio marinus TaxID=568069 RepID=A0A1J1HNL3_9DIPT|nr:CLUMA_CG003345, isoform A [Clunio marinus]